jgi:hypothetical protein
MTTEMSSVDLAASLTDDHLSQFTGSEHWYRHGLARDILFTDGAKYVADQAAPIGFSTRSPSRSAARSGSPPRNSRSGS